MKTPEEMGQKRLTINDIRSWRPCYDPSRHLPEDWSGAVIDILQHETIPAYDKLWVVCREELVGAKTLRLFAVWCARQVEHLLTDERSKAAIEVAERYANGLATDQELAAAWNAAGDAAGAAWAAGDAAGGAAGAAAWDAAGGAAGGAAWAAWAARDAAGAAAWDAARGAAWDAAGGAAGDAQIKKLIEMLG